MVATSSTAMDTASAVLALSKTAWKLGSSLSKLHLDAEIVDTTIRNLSGEVKSLGNECDIVYGDLEEVVRQSETGSNPRYCVDVKIWDCLATQIEETSRTLQELELLVKSVRRENFSVADKVQRLKKLDESKDLIASIRSEVCRHTDNLHTTLLLINT
jgi:hypothetical protein